LSKRTINQNEEKKNNVNVAKKQYEKSCTIGKNKEEEKNQSKLNKSALQKLSRRY